MKTKIDIRKMLSDGKIRKTKDQGGIDSGIKGLGIKIMPLKS
jgi:hypothetical protein